MILSTGPSLLAVIRNVKSHLTTLRHPGKLQPIDNSRPRTLAHACLPLPSLKDRSWDFSECVWYLCTCQQHGCGWCSASVLQYSRPGDTAPRSTKVSQPERPRCSSSRGALIMNSWAGDSLPWQLPLNTRPQSQRPPHHERGGPPSASWPSSSPCCSESSSAASP